MGLKSGVAVKADAAVNVLGGLSVGIGTGECSSAVGDKPHLAVLKIDGGISGRIGSRGANGSLRSIEGIERGLELGPGSVAESCGVFEIDPGVVNSGVSVGAGR